MWKGTGEELDGGRMPRKARLEIEVEAILIGLRHTEGWSSRVQADKIVQLVTDTVLGNRIPGETKPWEAMNATTPDQVWSLIKE